MFYYYGMKRSLVDKYPAPKHKTIIEPFAGSASYSLRYWDHNVVLCEKDKRIYNIWKYLIHKATKKRILSLPILTAGDHLDDPQFEWLTTPEKHLIGYHIQYGPNPGKVPSKSSPFNKWTPRTRQKIADNLHKIRHWKIIHGSYEGLRNRKATWFVDPPYQGKGGAAYKCNHKDIDYTHLAKWCKERKGQIIVCENEEAARWLPFKKLTNIMQRARHHTEMVYLKNNP